ncbi:MAG TPA: hypothetical protein VFU22_28440 [Roseiflexaceae bacterium]|nr:hypothetical protein [Roseiflexaceae bacterium]
MPNDEKTPPGGVSKGSEPLSDKKSAADRSKPKLTRGQKRRKKA